MSLLLSEGSGREHKRGRRAEKGPQDSCCLVKAKIISMFIMMCSLDPEGKGGGHTGQSSQMLGSDSFLGISG